MSEEVNTNNEIRMPSGTDLLLASSPHIRAGRGVRSIMLKVVLALLPAAAAGVWWFGWDGLSVMLFSIVFALAVEGIWCKIAHKPMSTLGDGSALVTGLLLGMNLPPGTAWWICLIGAGIAICLGKQIYGGLGHNLFNPVLVARVALLIALPAAMTTWLAPREVCCEPETKISAGVDARTTATPLGEVKYLSGKGYDETKRAELTNGSSLWRYALGAKAGCVGETSSVALLLGGLLLLFWGIIKWEIPVGFILTTLLVTGIVNWVSPETTAPALFHLVTGGLLIGAFFMATDMVTSPITTGGQILFGIGCGLITAVIRIWGNYPEGVSFSILLMNAAVPLLDRACARRPFGFVRKKSRA